MTATPGAFDPTGRRSALVTPEAVTVDLPLADIGSRALGILIDLSCIVFLLYTVAIIGGLALGSAFAAVGGPGWLAIVAVLLLNFLVLWGVPVGTEALWNGRTIGMAAVGLRVVTVDGGPIRFRHAALRWLLAFVDFYLLLGIPALVTALVTRRGQRLGDLAAGTVVIRDRGRRLGRDQPIIWQIPGALVPYAQTLDARGLTAGDYALVRTTLLRLSSLPPEHRDRVAREVATAIAERIRHVPPPGTHPEALLLSVAALVQQRGAGQPAQAGWAGPPAWAGHPGWAGPAAAPPTAPPPPRDPFAPR